MRRAGLFAAALALTVAGPAFAQVVWDEFTDQSEFFTVNFPGKPNVQTTTYKKAKGTSLPAKVYTAKDARGGEYKITVVNYATAQTEEATAITEAGKAIRSRGDVKFDALEHQNNMKSQRISLVLPGTQRLLLGEALLSHDHRLYVLEADTPPKVSPPAQFQASLEVLDAGGNAIRYRNPESDERVDRAGRGPQTR